MNLRDPQFEAWFPHAHRQAKERLGFYSARATGKRHYAEHARDPKSFQVRQPDIGDAIHRGIGEKRFSQPARPKSSSVNHASHEGSDYGYSNLRPDSGWNVGID